MTDLTSKVLASIVAKREAAAKISVSAEQAEERFKASFATLLEAITELKAAGIANESGRFSWEFIRKYDSQRRLESFDGIRLGFGEPLSDQYGNTTRFACRLSPTAAGYHLQGGPVDSHRLYERAHALGKYGSYSSSAWIDIQGTAKETEITELLIDYIALAADR